MYGERRNLSRDFERSAKQITDFLVENDYSCQLYSTGLVECTQHNECIVFKPDNVAYEQVRQLAEGKLSQPHEYPFMQVLRALVFGKVS